MKKETFAAGLGKVSEAAAAAAAAVAEAATATAAVADTTAMATAVNAAVARRPSRTLTLFASDSPFAAFEAHDARALNHSHTNTAAIADAPAATSHGNSQFIVSVKAPSRVHGITWFAPLDLGPGRATTCECVCGRKTAKTCTEKIFFAAGVGSGRATS